MVELPRGLARSFRAVLRKCVPSAQEARRVPVACHAGPSGLEMCCAPSGLSLRWSVAGKRPAGKAVFHAELLGSLSGKGAGPVRLEQDETGEGEASWEEEGAKSLSFRCMEHVAPRFPSCTMSDPGEGFQDALAEAARTAAREQGRHALRCVLLRGEGKDGSVTATDGRQLFRHGGFELPWQGDAQVPALSAFGCAELAGPTLLLGRGDGRVVLSIGSWLLSLEEQESRHYPDVAKVLAGPWSSKLMLHEEDAAALAEALPGLPGKEADSSPVVLEMGRASCVRAGDKAVALAKSKASGPALRVETDRCFLLRALSLGFREVAGSVGKPLRCADARRTYLWMPLGGGRPVPPPDAKRREETMPVPNGHGPSEGEAVPGDALAEAEVLRAQLQEALARTARLVAALKERRREERAVKTAVASLRKLGGFG